MIDAQTATGDMAAHHVQCAAACSVENPDIKENSDAPQHDDEPCDEDDDQLDEEIDELDDDHIEADITDPVDSTPLPPNDVSLSSATNSSVSSAANTSARGNRPVAQSAGVHYPPDNHPIWGQHGIMFGIVPNVSDTGRITYILDPRYKDLKPTAKVFGDGMMGLGAWFPSQRVALFRGAHGSSQAGIYGNTTDGAFSLVLSGSGIYKGLDDDRGDVIVYSGPGSATNEDPVNLPRGSEGHLYLLKSRETGRPVRVLRAGGRKRSVFAPSVGIRYDGLYTVTSYSDDAHNEHGGRYVRAVLTRVPNQRVSLYRIRLGFPEVNREGMPTAQQIADFRRIKHINF